MITLIFLLYIDLSPWFYSAFNPIFQILFITLILGSCHNVPSNHFLSSKLLFILGEASYAMYILQAPVKTFTQQFMFKVIGYRYHNGVIFNLSIYLSIIIVAYFVTFKIDSKIRAYFK